MGYQRKFHNATGIRHLETLLHWTLSCLLVSLFSCLTTNCFCSCPVTNSPLGSRRQLSSPPRTTSGYGEISCPRILCLVSRQNRQLNRLLWQPTPIVLHCNVNVFHCYSHGKFHVLFLGHCNLVLIEISKVFSFSHVSFYFLIRLHIFGILNSLFHRLLWAFSGTVTFNSVKSCAFNLNISVFWK